MWISFHHLFRDNPTAQQSVQRIGGYGSAFLDRFATRQPLTQAVGQKPSSV